MILEHPCTIKGNEIFLSYTNQGDTLYKVVWHEGVLLHNS